MVKKKNWDFPGGSGGKESACNAGDPGSIPGSERSLRRGWQPTPVVLPGESHGWRILKAPVHEVTESDTTE